MLTFPLNDARAALIESIDAFGAALDALSEYQLLGPTRCHGWAAVDLVAHANAGINDMFISAARATDASATRDAAELWQDFPPNPGDHNNPDNLARILAERRLGSASMPGRVREQYRDTAAAIRRLVERLTDGNVESLGHVQTAGDFLAIWTVEFVVHQLDLQPAAASGPTPVELPPCAATGLAVTRQTVEALAGAALPWDDATVALVGSGRLPVPGDIPDRAALPVFG